jgi:hypothetical protein
MPTTDQILKWNGSAAADSTMSEDPSTHVFQLGGKTSAQPGFKADSDTIRARKADDSGDTIIKGSGFAALGTSGILVYLGGVTASEIGLKQVSGPELQVRKANDSGFADLHVNQLFNENQYVNLNAFGGFEFQTSSKVKRIAILRDADTGSSNGGSDMYVECYDDSGMFLGPALRIIRASQAMLLYGDLLIAAAKRILGPSARQAEGRITSSTTALGANLAVWDAGFTSLATQPPAGLYRVNYYLKCTANGTGTNLNVTVNWNDGTANNTVQGLTILPIAGRYVRDSIVFKCDGVNMPTITVQYNGITVSPTYELSYSLEQLSNI